MPRVVVVILALGLGTVSVSAQYPETVFLEELTWTEVRDAVADGVTTVMKAGDEFGVVAENDLESYTLSSVAVSQGQLFMRNDGFLYCIGERRP